MEGSSKYVGLSLIFKLNLNVRLVLKEVEVPSTMIETPYGEFYTEIMIDSSGCD